MILKLNFYCKQGEIDIITKDKNEIVFIEVKSRSNTEYGLPSESVTKQKIQHLYKTDYISYSSVRKSLEIPVNNISY